MQKDTPLKCFGKEDHYFFLHYKIHFTLFTVADFYFQTKGISKLHHLLLQIKIHRDPVRKCFYISDSMVQFNFLFIG